MSAERERLEQQVEIDAEVAASAAAMRALGADDRNGDARQVAAGAGVREQRGAELEVLREQFLQTREAVLAAQERAAQQREASSMLRSRLLDTRERELDARERVADQREIDVELASWTDSGAPGTDATPAGIIAPPSAAF